MVMKLPRRASKRKTGALKYKIEKKYREHKRKQIKLSKQSKLNGTAQWKTKHQLINIPNSFPLKDEILNEITQYQQQQIQLNKQKRLDQINNNTTVSTDAPIYDKSGVVVTELSADEISTRYAGQYNSTQLSAQRITQSWNDIKHTIQQSNIVLYIIDIRDPIGSISNTVQQLCSQNNDTPFMFVLNKCDLVPITVVNQWLTYFHHNYIQYPCICFYSAQHDSFDKKSGVPLHDIPHPPSRESLVDMLCHYKTEDNSNNDQNRLIVGIIGFANVGKSSFINTLNGAGSVGAGPNPYYTKSNTRIKLSNVSNDIILIDTPAVPPTVHNPGTHTIMSTHTPEVTLYALISHFTSGMITNCFRIAQFTTPSDSMVLSDDDYQTFLHRMAIELNTLTRDGKPNLHVTAREILKKWNLNQIAYCSIPPSSTHHINHIDTQQSELINMFHATNQQTCKQLQQLYKKDNNIIGSRPMNRFLVLTGTMYTKSDESSEDDESVDNNDNDNIDEQNDDAIEIESADSDNNDDSDVAEELSESESVEQPHTTVESDTYDFTTDFVDNHDDTITADTTDETHTNESVLADVDDESNVVAEINRAQRNSVTNRGKIKKKNKK